MPPETGTALLILVAFLLPGYATVLFRERTIDAWREVSPFERLLQSGYYSVWSYVLLALVALVVGIDRQHIEQLYEDHQDAPAELVWRAGLAILAPSLLVAYVGQQWEKAGLRERFYEKARINSRHRVPTAWDHFFGSGKRAMALATLRDGRVVGGYYGSKSFAAYSKDGRDIYLEERWTLDAENWFENPADDTHGVWLPGEEVAGVEIYHVNDDHDEEDRAPQTPEITSLEGGEGT